MAPKRFTKERIRMRRRLIKFLSRFLILVILAAAGLGITGVWWAISLSSMLKGIVAFIWFSILQKKIL